MNKERSEPQIRETVAFRMIVALNLIVKPFIENHARILNLSLPEWRCMLALASEPGSSGEDVSRIMGMDRMTVSRTLRRLEKAGRASRQPDPSNRKRYQWRLTTQGWSLFDRIGPEALKREREFLGPISKPHRAIMRKALDDAISAMRDPSDG